MSMVKFSTRNSERIDPGDLVVIDYAMDDNSFPDSFYNVALFPTQRPPYLMSSPPCHYMSIKDIAFVVACVGFELYVVVANNSPKCGWTSTSYMRRA